jgi:four helix bundle protein
VGEKQFRFQDLEIWRRGAALSHRLFRLADQLENRRLFRFAEQLRGAALSITNNIAEGSGSTSSAEFAQFLSHSRRSVFEVANILLILLPEKLVEPDAAHPLLSELEEQSRMTIAFIRSLRS